MNEIVLLTFRCVFSKPYYMVSPTSKIKCFYLQIVLIFYIVSHPSRYPKALRYVIHIPYMAN